METWPRHRVTQRRQITVLGTPVRDAYLRVDAIEFTEQRVVFQLGEAQHTVAYAGEPMRFGEKRCALTDLSGLRLAGCTVRNGGGVYHTAAQLARRCWGQRLPVAISALDAVMTWPELDADYRQMGIRHLSLAQERAVTNLVLTDGHPDRIILKSPDVPASCATMQSNQLDKIVGTRRDVLVVNSPKSVALAHSALQAAYQSAALQYSVLTPSLSIEDRIELLLGRDQASVCNLSELALLAAALGIDCPAQEETADCEDVAQAMMALSSRCRTGDLVVTLGARGCLAGDRTTGALVHIGLQPAYRQRVQAQVLAHPERKNGIGDCFFGSFVLWHLLTPGSHGNRTGQATRRASMEMAARLAPELSPAPSWFALQWFPHRFGASAQGRKQVTSLRKVRCVGGREWILASREMLGHCVDS